MCKDYHDISLNWARAALGCSATVIFAVVGGVTTVSAFAGEVPQAASADYVAVMALADVVSDTNLDSAVRYKAFNDLVKLDGGIDAFRRIITESDGAFGCLAAWELIRVGLVVEDFTDIVLPECLRWDNHSRLILLQDISYAPEPRRFRLIAKNLLNAALSEKGGTQATQEELAALAGRASEIFCRRDDCQPKNLVLAATEAFPTSSEIWLAAACANVFDGQGLDVAVRAYQDGRNPMRARMAAACAVARQDANARAFVLDELSAFFVKYGGASLAESIDRDVMADRDASRRYMVFRERLQTLEVLRCLDGEFASEVVFAQLVTKNERIREVLTLVAAMRWPNRLLTWLEGNSDVRAGAKVLALIATKNPKLEDRCMRLGDETAIRKETSDLKRANNPAAFFSTLGIFIRGL